MNAIPEQIADGITTYSKTLILVLLVLTVAIGAGIPMVNQESDTEQFESESPATEAQEYIQANFTVTRSRRPGRPTGPSSAAS